MFIFCSPCEEFQPLSIDIAILFAGTGKRELYTTLPLTHKLYCSYDPITVSPQEALEF